MGRARAPIRAAVVGSKWWGEASGAGGGGRGHGELQGRTSNPLNPGTCFSWQPQKWSAPLPSSGSRSVRRWLLQRGGQGETAGVRGE